MRIHVAEGGAVAVQIVGAGGFAVASIGRVDGRDIEEGEKRLPFRGGGDTCRGALELSLRGHGRFRSHVRRPMMFGEQRGENAADRSARVEEPDAADRERMEAARGESGDQIRLVEDKRPRGCGFASAKASGEQAGFARLVDGRRKKAAEERVVGGPRERGRRVALLPFCNQRGEMRGFSRRERRARDIVAERIEHDPEKIVGRQNRVHIKHGFHERKGIADIGGAPFIHGRSLMPAITNRSLHSWLQDSPFQGYAYAYPHKTAYRPLQPSVDLAELWCGEDQRHLFLYLHVPFCEMRCGFCNLFTTTNPDGGFVEEWMQAIFRQARAVKAVLGGEARFARGAIGGGTPTFLDVGELAALLGGLHEIFGQALTDTPFSVEMSPATVTAEKLSLLREFGMHRASVGVQSFLEEETRSAGRPQKNADVRRALDMMTASGVALRNIDLIYGIPGQTTATWQASLEQAVAHAPEEIYLYPLYVRPLTGLQRARREPGDNRGELYRQGRDWLLARGYRQVSMRLFRSTRIASVAEPAYVCQEDGMLGLGPGARSYTRALHYSSDYAVGRSSIVQIVKEFSSRDADYLSRAHYGVSLEREDQQRRYLIKSLLRAEGLARTAYEERFGADCFVHWPQLNELVEHGLAAVNDTAVVPTLEGLAWSDAIGPWLYSEDMRHRMAEFDWE